MKYYIDQQICEETGEDYYVLQKRIYTEGSATNETIDTFGSQEDARNGAKLLLEDGKNGYYKYIKGTLAWELGNILKGVALPISLAGVPAGIEWDEDDLIDLSINWVETKAFFTQPMNPIVLKLAQIIDEYFDKQR